MSVFGVASLSLALVLGVFALVGSVAAIRFKSSALETSARRALYACFGCSLVAALALVAAFVTHDFSIRYVAEHSNTAMSPLLTWVAFYAGNAGSLLYILVILGLLATLALVNLNRKLRVAMPYHVILFATMQIFYLVVLLFFENPFATFANPPADGMGLNPLLRHPAMFIHPPLLMAGLIGTTVPFVLVFGTLLAGEYDDQWLAAARKWGIAIWFLLGIGMLLGAWWAYTILGWGGYWSWDPIENVALMPWLVLTAFIHSIMVQQRRGMFKLWNIALLGIVFVLAQLGMFINRGGPVVSVHTFAASALGNIFLGFMIATLVFTATVYIWRYRQLAGGRTLESFVSREASILLNTFLMLTVTIVILWGVVFPAFSNLAGNEIAIAAPYYNRTVGPVLLLILFAMGIGPLLPWRRATKRALMRRISIPFGGLVITVAVLALVGIRNPAALVAFGVLVFAALAVLGEWRRGVRARMRGGQRNPLIAFAKLVNGNRPRHGGYVVHLAMLVLAFGVIGTQFYDVRTSLTLGVGESAVFESYRIQYIEHSSRLHAEGQRFNIRLEVYDIARDEYATGFERARAAGKNGFVLTSGDSRPSDRYLATFTPGYDFFLTFSQIAVHTSIRSTLVEDLYIVPAKILEDGRTVLNLSVKPLAIWLWLAGPVFIVGTAIVLWPQRHELTQGGE